MGLLIPGFIPSPIGEFSRYVPTTLEILVTLGNWAMGFLILTILLKGAIGVLLGDIKYGKVVSVNNLDTGSNAPASMPESA
jgi:molybdopterin-containing oxidoreductase family membrane subunit